MKFEKQLRIGNLIYGEFLDVDDVEQVEVCRVMAIDETASLGYGWPIMVEGVCGREWYSDFYGIPLTEEWLLKAGFEKLSEFFVFEFDCYAFLIQEYEPGKFIYNPGTFNYKDILYVHDLQNLLYVLADVELNINWKTDGTSK